MRSWEYISVTHSDDVVGKAPICDSGGSSFEPMVSWYFLVDMEKVDGHIELANNSLVLVRLPRNEVKFNINYMYKTSTY